MKLTAPHVQDWADAVRVVVARYSPEDLEDLESLIFLGRQEQELPSSAASDTELPLEDDSPANE